MRAKVPVTSSTAAYLCLQELTTTCSVELLVSPTMAETCSEKLVLGISSQILQHDDLPVVVTSIKLYMQHILSPIGPTGTIGALGSPPVRPV